MCRFVAHDLLGGVLSVMLRDFDPRGEVLLDPDVQQSIGMLLLNKRSIVTKVPDDDLAGRKLLMLENVLHDLCEDRTPRIRDPRH